MADRPFNVITFFTDLDIDRTAFDRSFDRVAGVGRIQHLTAMHELTDVVPQLEPSDLLVVSPGSPGWESRLAIRAITKANATPRLLVMSRTPEPHAAELTFLAQLDADYAIYDPSTHAGITDWWANQYEQILRDDIPTIGLELALSRYDDQLQARVAERMVAAGPDAPGVRAVTDRIIGRWAGELRMNHAGIDVDAPIRDGLSIVDQYFLSQPRAADGQPTYLDPWITRSGDGETTDVPSFDDEDEDEDEDDRSDEGRRIVAEVWHRDEAIRSVLPPGTELDLEIRIAVPVGDEIAADRTFPEPASRNETEDVEVVVRSPLWAEQPAPQTVSLPTSADRRREPSTSAAFAFTTGTSGTLAKFDIVVTFRNKPIQAAALTAVVRDRAIPTDRPSLRVYSLSGPDEPTATSRVVDASLDVRGAEIALLHNPSVRFPPINREGVINAIELVASSVLGHPGDRTEPSEIERLVVDLARHGAELRTMFRKTPLDQAQSIDMLSWPDSTILPLELFYDGVTPARDAQLCRHTGPLDRGCCPDDSTVVCPFAFWGLSRSISRTIAGASPKPPIPKPNPTSHTLRPVQVLYAAADVADAGCGSPMPSNALHTTATTLFPQTERVYDWPAWRRHVASADPELLVVLGHTQFHNGETILTIGQGSNLARPDIAPDVLTRTRSHAPLVILMSCASAQAYDAFGNLHGAFVHQGAGAVIGSLTRMNGNDGAAATEEILRSIAHGKEISVGALLTEARRSLVQQGNLLGLLLVSHGELDTVVE